MENLKGRLILFNQDGDFALEVYEIIEMKLKYTTHLFRLSHREKGILLDKFSGKRCCEILFDRYSNYLKEGTPPEPENILESVKGFIEFLGDTCDLQKRVEVFN